ncbi:hypothetical protein HQ545_01190 [Candidatus Woesearchaeota archaeon]|nr:hypothetical protein [Candidatus Woesearchaeota archaeon]
MKENEQETKELKLSNNILLALCILLIIINAYTFIIVSKETITGNAGSVGVASVCIGVPPVLDLPTPHTHAIINGTYNSTVNANKTDSVEFSQYSYVTTEAVFGTDNDTDGNGVFNATLDTTTLADGNCNYVIDATATGVCEIKDVSRSFEFSINNVDIAPTWTEFMNDMSTNFSLYTTWVNIPDAVIANENARIEFTTTNFDAANLDSNFNISNNSIKISASYLSNNCFNNQYTLTFFNAEEFADPIIIKNGAVCATACEGNYTGGTNFAFNTTINNEHANFSLVEGGNLSINISILEKTFDNSPSFNITTYMHGPTRDILYPADCMYMTDYDPGVFTPMETTGGILHQQNMPEQNWSYLATNMGHYDYIQHNEFFNGNHLLRINCTAAGQNKTENQTFRITYTQRDRVYYSDGDTINLYLRLEESGLTIDADFSELDSNYIPASVTVVNTGTEYNISYQISAGNTVADGKYNITIQAQNSSGYETMNGSIFAHLHNTWIASDIDNAFDCWTFRPGYHFDEIACDWESDLNQVSDLVDSFRTEISCFDTIDNDLDGKTDINDTDCAGIYYTYRRALGIDSAFLGDPCAENVCRLCLGAADNNDDGICDDPDGVNVRYLHKVRPGQEIIAKFSRETQVIDQPVRLSINFLNETFNVTEEETSIEQLQIMEMGGCQAGTQCKSVTATTFNSTSDTELRFTGNLNETIKVNISDTSATGPHPQVSAAKNIQGGFAFHNLVYFQVSNSAIINEGDNATYCFDTEDNDLNDFIDCRDISCNLVANPNNATQVCEYIQEMTCGDGFDNDMDGFIDCADNDCFLMNGTGGPCYSGENYNTTSCADTTNNDADYGHRCNNTLSISFETRLTNPAYSTTTALTDCMDYDCDGSAGNTTLGALCEYCDEITCNDIFDNDADGTYDCTGNAYRNTYERDCDRWHDIILTCPTTETNCQDNLDNDLDSDSLTGTLNWLSVPVYGGWDCQDLDCNGMTGNVEGSICQWHNETDCEDGFDNDADGLIDCADPSTCQGLSGADQNLTGLCRPCAAIENITADSCRDGDDTDYDGQTDCSDTDCYAIPGPGHSVCGFTETNCTDGIDNDFDTLIDLDDPDCITPTIYSDELGPGQCNDAIDNDNDNQTDCSDTDCENTMFCMLGSYENSCESIGNVGAIEVCRRRYVKGGEDSLFRYTANGLDTASVVLKAGNINYNLRDIAPILNSTTTFMIGTTVNFSLVNDTYGLKAQNTDGFDDDLNIQMTATAGVGLTPGDREVFISTSIPGVYASTTTMVYVAESEAPQISNITIYIDNIEDAPGSVNVTFTVNASDNGTYNSGISQCTIILEGIMEINSSSCTLTTNLTSGTYNVSTIAYDGAMNPSTLFRREFTFTADTIPSQTGEFYNPYPAPNYPDRRHLNDSELLNIGVNFRGGDGFTENATGCIVEIKNLTDVMNTQYVNLSVVAGEAHCNGQVDLSQLIFNGTSPSDVRYFTVSVYDTSSNRGTSREQDFNFCYYFNDNGTYRCMDECQLVSAINSPPILISAIPNQTWPRGTSLSVIDLDDYFMDPDFDPLTFTWDIDNARINVSIDHNNMITFTPDQSFYGFANIIFYASDPFSTTPSNTVVLEVIFVPFPPPPQLPAAGGGGGGGGGGTVNQTYELCEEDWTCTDWGPCLPSSYQFRNCRDRNECGTELNMPDTSRACLYIPTCRDKLKNQGEEGVDCGGPCSPCSNCEDSILNQGEEQVSQIISSNPSDVSDCGGPLCPVCPTCADNKQNQGENGVDCGGPCETCAKCDDRIRNQGEVGADCGGPCEPCIAVVEETAFNWNIPMLVASSAMIIAILSLAPIFMLSRVKLLRIKAMILNYYMRLLMMIFGKKKKDEKDLPILVWVNSHLDSINDSIQSKTAPQSVNSIDRLVRIFFKRVFLIRYAFTNEELMSELDKHKTQTILKKAVEILFEEISESKYGGEQLAKEDIHTLIEQVKVITERIVQGVESRKKKKITISEHDIDKIDETLAGARSLGVKEIVKRMDKK